MRDMNVRHDQIVVSDEGEHASALGPAMNRDELTDAVAMPDASLRALAFVFQILRGDADGRIGEEHIVFADLKRTLQEDMPFDLRSWADLDVRAYHRVRPYFRRFRDSRRRVNDRGRMDGHRSGLLPVGWPIPKHAQHGRLRDHRSIYRGCAEHLGERGLALGDFHLN